MNNLFSSFELSGLTLPNRIIMPPMTRVRSPKGLPTDQMALYYAQRASAGLIIAEGSPISPEAQGYLYNPGIYTSEQIEGWKLVTDSVKSTGGRIFLQLWHVGRVSHTSILPRVIIPVSSTDKTAKNTNAFGLDDQGNPGFIQASKPRSLETGEIRRIIDDFVQAAENAIRAGFDGIEIHAANGYLFDQFLNPLINDRNDIYSAKTVDNRIRLLLETTDAISNVIGSNRVGIRLSPFGTLNDCPNFKESEGTYLELGKALGERNIAFVHVMDQTGFFTMSDDTESTSDNIRNLLIKWRQNSPDLAIILDGSLSPEKAEELISENIIDMAGFGHLFIANPDLVNRLRYGFPLAYPDRKTFYTDGSKGYIDYPVYRQDIKTVHL